MSTSEVSAPFSSAGSDRLTLGVAWVRPGAGSFGGTLNPSSLHLHGGSACFCFAVEE